MSECQICGRKIDSKKNFCVYHAQANENVIQSFEEWKSAMDIDWDHYLVKLSEEESIGKFAREVVEFLMQQDDSSE
ncbi:MAG: hypothetical protein ACXAEF_00295 [Candidatus Thorarchaeota archaeon]|jgi:hypothetical protein